MFCVLNITYLLHKLVMLEQLRFYIQGAVGLSLLIIMLYYQYFYELSYICVEVHIKVSCKKINLLIIILQKFVNLVLRAEMINWPWGIHCNWPVPTFVEICIRSNTKVFVRFYLHQTIYSIAFSRNKINNKLLKHLIIKCL